ncbi:DNA-formamidopyrimidine glycosylase family protein [Thermoproteota archaeon]
MSFELPEAIILANQIKKELKGKTISSWDTKDTTRLQSIGFMNKDLKNYDLLIGGVINDVFQRGNTVLLKLSNSSNLILGPEYGGLIRYHPKDEVLSKYHLLLRFSDESYLTIRLISMGAIYATNDEKLNDNYMYKRDFLNGISPMEEKFTVAWFIKELSNYSRNIKIALVGKNALLVGLSNAAFQEIIFSAKIHPKSKASELTEKQIEALYFAIKNLVKERIRLGGKEKFIDLYGQNGGYQAKMGPNMKDQKCPICSTPIEKIQHGGGQIYLCPGCQVNL